MLTEFIDFVDSVLPYTSLEAKDKAKAAILQFKKEGRVFKYMMSEPLDQLSQGDILSRVGFVYFNKEGSLKKFSADALVLSASCHIDNKDSIILVPVLPLNEFDGNIKDLEDNIIYDYMYIPDTLMLDKFINFEYMNTYSKQLIMNGLNNNRIKRLGSLNQIGYYLLIIKLTVYLMRKEDRVTLNNRKQQFNI